MTSPRTGRRCLGVLLMLAGAATPAMAQAPRVEVGVGGVFATAVAFGTTEATLLDPSGGPLVLYRTTNRIAPGWGLEGLVSLRVRERLRVELALGWAATNFESQISGDFEGVPALSATQKVHQYSADLALTWRVMERGRYDVFVRGGGGGFREITSDRALVDNGWRAGVGAGTQIRLGQGSSGWLGRLAVRADVRVQARHGGIAFGDSGIRVSPSVFAGLVIGR